MPESLFNKVGGLQATLSKKRLWHSCFSVKFAKLLTTRFLQNTCRRLLLSDISLKKVVLIRVVCMLLLSDTFLRELLAWILKLSANWQIRNKLPWCYRYMFSSLFLFSKVQSVKRKSLERLNYYIFMFWLRSYSSRDVYISS